MKQLRIFFLSAVIFLVWDTVSFCQTTEINKAKADIAELLKLKVRISKRPENTDDKNIYKYFGTEKNVLAFDDRIEFRRRSDLTIIKFSDLQNLEVEYITNDQNESGVHLNEFLIMIQGVENGKKLADDFTTVKYQIEMQAYNDQLRLFEPVAKNYHELKVKPEVSEEQRKFIVQANSNFQEGSYEKAISNYLKAIETDPVAYPAAYSNLALLSAQLKRYSSSIFYMKKYLMLVPNASDARSAQDKIYEWEAKITN